jgi:hypothetical protein
MKLVTITKTTKKQYDCNGYRCSRKRLFRIYLSLNPNQGINIVLCPNHLNELGCAIADVLDPPRQVDTQINEVGWNKVINDNARKRRKA